MWAEGRLREEEEEGLEGLLTHTLLVVVIPAS